MHSSLDRAQSRLAYFDSVTKIDIRPDRPDGTSGAASTDSLSFGDVLDAINPLNHIPIVSDLMKSATGRTASPFAKIVGGALLGGPVGLIAGIANAAFESATGSSPLGAVYAAVTGEEAAATQVARASGASPEEELAQAVAEEKPQELAALEAEAGAEKPESSQASMVLASLEPETQAALQMRRGEILPAEPEVNARPKRPVNPAIASVTDTKAILDLYGNSPASAHSSYKKAQMLPYLKDVTTSHVL